MLGAPAAFAHPALVCEIAIGQFHAGHQRVIANLFYRGLVLHRAPLIGDTLTTTEVVAPAPDERAPRASAARLAALRVRTVDQEVRAVLNFFRCAMLPLRKPRRRHRSR